MSVSVAFVVVRGGEGSIIQAALDRLIYNVTSKSLTPRGGSKDRRDEETESGSCVCVREGGRWVEREARDGEGDRGRQKGREGREGRERG